MPAKEKLYTSHEVGRLLQMDPSSVVKWVNDGLLPAYRTPGGHRRIRTSDLLAFLKSHGMFVPPELGTGKRRVLLVDDDGHVLAGMRRAMKNHADLVDLLTAQSGIEALVLVGSHRPEVLVIDVNMPQLNGMEVLERLKTNPETKDIEVIMLTGKPSAELEKRALKLGAKAFRAKPISAEDLVAIISGTRPEP